MGYIVTNGHLSYPILGFGIPKGSILRADSVAEGWEVSGGPYKGAFIPAKHCEPFPLYQELLQKREEVVELMKEKDELHGENLRLTNRVKQLEKAKEVLPKDVAEALEDLKRKGHDYHTILWFVENPKSNSSFTLNRFAKINFERLLNALVNGYKVEKTLEERVSKGVKEIINKWYLEECGSTVREDMNVLSARISSFVQSVYGEGSALK